MKHLLNYKFEVFPTEPQRLQLNRILRETKYQWNKAVTTRRKLKTALNRGQLDHVIQTCLSGSEQKRDTNNNRRRAILKVQENFPQLNFESASRLYDIKNLVGQIIDVEPKHLNINDLSKELKISHQFELNERRRAKAKGIDYRNLPKLKTYWQMVRGINRHAGYAAKKYMDNSFQSKKGMARAAIRFNVSGSQKAIRWNQAVQPKQGQRFYGATGEPRYKRRGDGFAYQIHKLNINELVRSKRNSGGKQIQINALPDGGNWVDLAYHREIPKDGTIKQLTVNSRAGRYFVVLSTEISDSNWIIAPMQEGWQAGIDPGAKVAMMVGLSNTKTGELRYLAIHWAFLEKSLDKLERLQQTLVAKQGPRRKRTETEIEDELERYSKKRSLQRLPEEEKLKLINTKKNALTRGMIRQNPSKRWNRWTKRVSALQMKIANQRKDVLHKVSRFLAEGCELVGLGHWEPEREISYRKKIKMMKKEVKKGIKGATEALKSLLEQKTKQGPRGVRKRRRGGRDRSIATLRCLIDEKKDRASIIAFTDVNESRSTMVCSSCEEITGPTGEENLSVRVWQCSNCKTVHHRDLNSAFNILKKSREEISTAQVETLETGSNVVRTMTQGAMIQPVLCGPHATGSSGRDDAFIQEEHGLPKLWGERIPKSLKSLIQMKIVCPVTLQEESKIWSKEPHSG